MPAIGFDRLLADGDLIADKLAGVALRTDLHADERAVLVEHLVKQTCPICRVERRRERRRKGRDRIDGLGRQAAGLIDRDGTGARVEADVLNWPDCWHWLRPQRRAATGIEGVQVRRLGRCIVRPG
jgi:hypothetical protein